MLKSRITSLLTGLAALAIVWAAPLAAAEYKFDKTHTEIRFQWNHAGLSNQSGRFTGFDGTIAFDSEDPAKAKIDVTIDINSITTTVPKLDEHLLGADFFDAAKHPKATFRSTSVRQTGADTGMVTGDLTIKGVTRPATLNVTFNFEGVHPLSPYLESYRDAYYTSFSAQTTILRSEFGIARAAPLTSDEILITIETELRQVN